jgi:hypothetical protein
VIENKPIELDKEVIETCLAPQRKKYERKAPYHAGKRGPYKVSKARELKLAKKFANAQLNPENLSNKPE